MVHTRRRGKLESIFRNSVVALAASIALLFLQTNESRADIWSWINNLVAEDPEDAELEASLGQMELPPGAIISAPGQVRSITLGKDLLELYPSTAVTVERNGEKTVVYLISGTIRAKVAKRKKLGLFEVQTPLLVGAVKGTVFEVSARNGVSALSVYEGRVGLKPVNAVGGMDVVPGKTATVTDRDKGAKLGDTPTGGAAVAARERARAAGLADASAPSRRGSKPVAAQATDYARPVTTPANTQIDAPAEDEDSKKQKKQKKEKKGDKENKHHGDDHDLEDED